MRDDRGHDLDPQIGKVDDGEIEIEFVDVDDGSPVAEEPAPSTDLAAVAGEAAADDQVEKLQAELDHVRDVYLRKLAEFDNFRKRVEREREESRRLGAEDFIRDLLPVIDNFDRALQHTNDESGAFRQGVEMIAKQLGDTLARRGVVEINPIGQIFDPERHEAVQRVEDPSRPPGTVSIVMAKGYLAGERLLRPALVGVTVAVQGEGDAAGGDS
ncbi:MAG: nucleotide exchange factor GrpE [Thermoanaerobaculales bacterium]|jgi:molecular chaperone GrpE|nr:nucleotide exchange factor GrpE [Thermoanaerobaculales bacterium]